jgi:ParB-like chromosome segregation protein Spo0J
MPSSVTYAFKHETLILPLDSIRPLRKLPEGIEGTLKYKRIKASIREVGLIEPLVVFPRKEGDWALLDGTIRHDILKKLGEERALCLVATEDETYTYNQSRESDRTSGQ